MILQYKFYDLKELVEFCEFITPLDVEITAYIGKNQSVDAKSILGICSMDTSEGCHVKIHALSTDSQVEKFVDDVKEYINE